MFEKKKLMINCEALDTRRMKEEDYAGYEHITINAELVLVGETSRSILARLPVTLNNEKMVELADDEPVELRTVNGSMDLTGDTAVASHTLLVVNGALRIHPGAEQALAQYVQIVANGSVECPKSMEGYLARMSINGSTDVYPDDCIPLKRNFVLDEFFPVRAKENAHYYARKVIVKNAKVDASALAKKGVHFTTKRFLVPEELLETAVPLFDEQAECQVVPRGMALIPEDATINDALLRKHGGKLFIYGDADVDEKDADGAVLGKLEKLIVRGTLSVTARQEKALEGVDAEYDELYVAKGRRIGDKLKVRVDQALLDGSPEGVSIQRVVKVVIAEDVTSEAILDKLSLENVAHVACAESQESAVAAVSENVAKIGAAGEGEGDDAVSSVMDTVMGALKGISDTKHINAESYVM